MMGKEIIFYSRFYVGLNMLLAPVGAPMYER